jgi:hypothetical protein
MFDNSKILEYFKSKIENFEKTTKRGSFLFTCPNIKNHKFVAKSPTATFIPGTDNKIYCLNCGWKGTLYDAVRLLENNPLLNNDKIISLLTNSFGMDIYPELDYYEKYGWSLFVIAKNSKKPIKDEHWREEEFNSKDKSKWIEWLEAGNNLAVNCEFSNVMIVDFDDKEISPEFEVLKNELKKMLEDNKTLIQNTPRGGKHYVFQFDGDLCFKQKVDLGGLKIDTRTHKGYFLVSPSKINNLNYNWVNLGSDIKSVSPELKSKLLELLKVESGRKSEMSSEMSQQIEEIKQIKEGGRNDLLVSLGGLLTKSLSSQQTEFVLSIINQKFMKPPLPQFELKAMMGSLEGYKATEEQTQEQAIYKACQVIQTDIGAKDIIDHVFPGDNKKRAIVDKYLAKFHKEGKLSRRGRGRYDCKQKVEWVNEFQEQSKEINYKIPYFDDVAYFRNGDIILIGAPTGRGKTTIAINFIKQMRAQGITPFYLSLEAGSRHEKTAQLLGLTQKDYYIPKEIVNNPLQIEIEPNSFSIIDWLYFGDDFAQTQAVFKHLNDEMVRKGGILVVFTQLKEDYNYFAVNLVKSFPRFAARFIYDDETGVVSHFQVDKITDPKGHYQNAIISTEFNFETKELIKKNNL